jgi:predicted ArsR family transcriptional regulator
MAVSISELWRALQNQKLDIEIMRCIARTRSPNVSNLADVLGKDRKSVKFHLYKLKAEGCVKDHWARMMSPVSNQILCHEWQLTEKGEHLLREGGLIFEVCGCDGFLPVWNPFASRPR